MPEISMINNSKCILNFLALEIKNHFINYTELLLGIDLDNDVGSKTCIYYMLTYFSDLFINIS